MKRKIQSILACLFISQVLSAQITGTAVITGTSSSQTPYLMPMVSNATITSIITATNSVGGYSFCGLPDGMGAYDNGDGTFTALISHEINNAGITRAHGGIGAFVSKWVINKTTLAVVSGTDLIQSVYLNSGGGYTLTPAVNFTRFCSSDLPASTAFYNAASGLGTQNKIFMNGEETGAEGRAFGHVVNGTDAGKSYELPHLGKASWENAVASPFTGTKTVVCLTDDATPGQVYFYIGNKTNSGLDVDKAGLTNGKLYGVAVAGLAAEVSGSFPAANTTFSLIDLGQVNAITGASLNTMSNNLGVTTFLRPEDSAWDPANPKDCYFVTTNSFASPSRLWRLRFNNINSPELGGTITAVLEGTEGQVMFDNIGFDNYGNLLLQEDVGSNAHLGKIWNYNTATDASTIILTHDASRFVTGGPNFLTQDEEASGVIDASSILGAGWFLTVDQAHYGIPGAVVEGGQLLAFYNPMVVSTMPEINLVGNANNINLGAIVTSTTNNTDFGTVFTGSSLSQTFAIKNIGPGPLNVSNITITGANAAEFVMLAPPAFPFTLAPGVGQQVITLQFTPTAAGSRTAMVTVTNNDFNESSYNFVVGGTGTVAVSTGILNNTIKNASVSIFPNPSNNEAIIHLVLDKEEHVVINVFDLTGKKVISSIEKNLEKGEQQISLNTSLFNNGMYFLKINLANKTTTMKLVVSH